MAMPHISELKLFDSCVTLGRTCLPGVPELTVEGVLAVMDRHDIAEALAQSNEARLMMGQVPPLHWMWRGLCEALEARRVVCLVDFAPLRHAPTNHPGESLMIDKLGEIAAAHPDLPLILSHLSGGLGVAAPPTR